MILLLRWAFLLGFFFLVAVGVWAIVTITRMQREQAIAIALLQALSARAGLKEKISELKDHTHASSDTGI